MSAADSICEDQVCYGDSFILIDVATGKSVNNGVSNRSGYLGLCDPNKSGEISIVMRRRDKHGRDGDPICYGDTNVVLEVIESKDEKRFIGEISNFKKNNSKTDGGYLISGYSQSSKSSKKILFRVDGESIWSGVDLTKTYTIRGVNCVNSPKRRKLNGELGSKSIFSQRDFY
jgi:hypothetical protein